MKRFPLLVCLFLLLLLVPGGLAIDYPAPRISGVSPSSVSNTDTHLVTVTITGSDFVPGTTAKFKPCYEPQFSGTVEYVSSTEIKATFNFYGLTPSPTGKIFVYNPEGEPSNPFLNFEVYGSSSTGTTTTTTETTTTTVTTTTPEKGKNSVFFETNPPGATIFLNGEEVGTSTFTYYTDRDGSFSVVAKKVGYADYEDKITIVEGGPRARFYGQLTQLSSTTNAVTKTAAPGKTTTTIKNATTTIKKSTLKIPTPLGTDPPLTEESPVDPAIALWAAGIAIGLMVIRRR